MSGRNSSVDRQDEILADKLAKLGRLSYLKQFQELRSHNISTPDLEEAVKYLYEDAYSVENRVLAVYLVLRILWPPNFWYQRHPGKLWRELVLQCPYRCEKKATQPAFILINESNKNTGPISTVILVGQHGRLDFDLKEPLGLYMLFEAALDSELAFQQKFRCPLATLPSMEMVRANMEAHHRLQRENERHFAHLIDAERAWLRRRNYKVQLKSRIRFLQSHLPRSGRSPRKPYRPSGLQYGLLSTVPAVFHFYTGQMENAAGFLPHPFKPKPSTTITLDGTPSCERDRVALRRMMTHTVVFLAHKNAPLSMELRELQAKICDFATQNEQESTSVVSSAITSTAPREWSQNTKDEVHIICRKDVTDSFNVWVLVAGYGRKKWVVKIQRQQTEHLQASTQAVAGFKRKADDAVEELE